MRRLPAEETYATGGKIFIPDTYKNEQSQNFYRGIVISYGEPVYLAHKWRITLKSWPAEVGDEILFKSHGTAGQLDAGFISKDGFEYVIVMYHEVMAKIVQDCRS